jgi:hypothetical protein
MRKTLILWLLLTGFCAWGQEETANPRFRIPKLVVKWSPLHLIGHYPTFQIALEQRLSDKLSVQYDLGPIISFNSFPGGENSFRKRGFKAKLELRHYTKWVSSKYWRLYYGGELYYNRVDYKKRKTFGVDCEDGECDYFRRFNYDMYYREPGINVKAGALFHVYRFCIDFNMGWAARFIGYEERNKPKGDGFREEEGGGVGFLNFSPKEQSRTDFLPTACIRVGYTIK